MRLDPDDPKVRQAVFGQQVQDFLRTDIGDYLLKFATAEEAEAIEALLKTHPWRRRRIQQLQNQIATARNFQHWLADAIASGLAALEVMKGEREDG